MPKPQTGRTRREEGKGIVVGLKEALATVHLRERGRVGRDTRLGASTEDGIV